MSTPSTSNITESPPRDSSTDTNKRGSERLRASSPTDNNLLCRDELNILLPVSTRQPDLFR